MKFRAFDTEEKEFVADCFAQIFFLNRVGELMSKKRDLEIEKSEPRYSIVIPTGLKDKNGKEIFEGDILETDTHGSFGLKREKHQVCYVLGQFKAGTLPLELVCSFFSPEILGSKYTNPELLDVS